MEFAKYYNVTNRVNKLVKEGKLPGYADGEFKGIFVCEDTNDFWICRILEGMNEDYVEEEGTYLIERDKIDKYEFCEFIKEQKNDDTEIGNRVARDIYIDECLDDDTIINSILSMDDDNGLEGWDSNECRSYEECIEILDDGHGIMEEQ